MATASIQPLAWETPYASGDALKRQKKKKTCTRRQENMNDFPNEVSPSFIVLPEDGLVLGPLNLLPSGTRHLRVCANNSMLINNKLQLQTFDLTVYT